MADQHAFRAPGGAGGKDDIGRMVRRRARDRHPGGVIGRQRRVIQQNFALVGETRLLRRVSDDQAGRGVFQHHRQPLVRITGVQRQIGGARFDDRHQRQRQEHRARQRHRHDVARPHALRHQLARQRRNLLARFAVGEIEMRIRQRRCVRRGLRLLRQQLAQRGRRHRVRRVVDPRQQRVIVGGQHIGFADRQRCLRGELRQQQRQPLQVRLQFLAAVTLGVGQQLHLQLMVFVDKQRNLQIAHRPGGQIVGNAFDTGEIQLVIEHFEVEDRAVQRFAVADAAQIALHLFGVVALMAAHRFQLAADAGGSLIQRGLRLEVHLHRQHVDHRAGSAQGGRSGAAHKDKTGAEARLAAQARYPQRHQRHRHIGGVQLLLCATLHQFGEGLRIAALFQSMDARRGRLPSQRLRAERGRRRQLPRFFEPEIGVALPGRRLPVSLVFRHHVAERRKWRRLQRVAAAKVGINRRHAASDGGEAETVHQQMVIALIPEPAVIRQTHHHMTIQRCAAAGAQIARQIDVHQRARGGFRVRRRRQIDKFRLVHRQRVV